MANENIFPQIPSTVWKGVWGLLRKSPTRKLDDASLAAELNVQQTAAKQYLNELVRLGILEPEGTPTELAGRWRQDGDNTDIITEILQKAYPESLLQLAPLDDLNRDKIVRWFMGQQLGEGSRQEQSSYVYSHRWRHNRIRCAESNYVVSSDQSVFFGSQIAK